MNRRETLGRKTRELSQSRVDCFLTFLFFRGARGRRGWGGGTVDFGRGTRGQFPPVIREEASDAQPRRRESTDCESRGRKESALPSNFNKVTGQIGETVPI